MRFALLLLFSGVALAQLPVTGRIVDDLAGEPVVNARIGLLNDAFEIPPITKTGADGRFSFSVPAGTYKLAVEKAGFFAYPNDPLEVRDGKPGELSLILVKMRSVSGRVVWSDGEPAGAGVFTRPASGPGTRDLNLMRLSSNGSFSLSGLRPGRYTITVDPGFGSNPGRTATTMQYPSPDAVAAGQAIDLRYVTERAVGDILLSEISGTEVGGRIQVTDKITMTGSVSVDLVPITGDGTVVGAARVSGPRNGTFRFPKVAPGTYYLVGNTQVPNYVVFGVQQIQVGSNSIRDIVMALPDSPPTITGRFQIETEKGLTGAPISFAARVKKPPVSVPGKQAQADGQFEFNAASSAGGTLGPYELVVNAGIPADAYIASVTQGEAKATRDPFVVNVGAGPVQVLLKRDGATLRGKVAITGNPARPAYIVLAPKERDAALFFKTVLTDRDGVFQLEGISPGSYDLFAFDRKENYADELTLRTYAAAGTAVTLAAGQNLTLNLNVVTITE
ncbi:MAG: carboxypeptidase-like regulatory domain-containing protein [Acidobacteriota bacterium]